MKVALIFGGSGPESEVSVVTAIQVFNAVSSKHDILPVMVDKNKRFFVLKKGDKMQDFTGFFKSPKNFLEVVFESGGKVHFAGKNKCFCEIEAVFNCCHGAEGEDGRLNSFFDVLNIPVSCGDSFALALAMDKCFSKQFFKSLGLPVVEGFWFMKNEYLKNKAGVLQNIASMLPVVVKPSRLGSSVGVQFCSNLDEVESAVLVALAFDDKVLIEQGLVGFRELNCAVLSLSSEMDLSEVEEPFKMHEILTFKDKYLAGSKSSTKGKLCMQNQSRKFPADIDNSVRKQIHDIVSVCVQQLGLFGVCRFDFMLVGKKLFLNEINAIPGSMAFYFFGNKFQPEEIFSKMIFDAIKRFWENKKLQNTFISIFD